MKKYLLFLIYFLLISNNLYSQETVDKSDDDEIDFAIPGNTESFSSEEDDCQTSQHSDLLNLLNFKLKKVQPDSS